MTHPFEERLEEAQEAVEEAIREAGEAFVGRFHLNEALMAALRSFMAERLQDLKNQGVLPEGIFVWEFAKRWLAAQGVEAHDDGKMYMEGSYIGRTDPKTVKFGTKTTCDDFGNVSLDILEMSFTPAMPLDYISVSLETGEG